MECWYSAVRHTIQVYLLLQMHVFLDLALFMSELLSFEEVEMSCIVFLLFANSMPNYLFLKHVDELCLDNIFSTLDLLHTYAIHFYVRLLVVR